MTLFALVSPARIALLIRASVRIQKPLAMFGVPLPLRVRMRLRRSRPASTQQIDAAVSCCFKVAAVWGGGRNSFFAHFVSPLLVAQICAAKIVALAKNQIVFFLCIYLYLLFYPKKFQLPNSLRLRKIFPLLTYNQTLA